MLWQKDSSDRLYIDLSDDISKCIDNFRFNSKKNNVLSLHARKEGNEKYSRKDFKGAMDKYNESIRFANDSNSLSLGYGNRSSCFYSLQMYDRCLVDIELAKNANYPENLMHKLVGRKQKCLQKLESKEMLTFDEPKLSSKADDKIQSISNALKIGTNEEYGRLVIAKRDIEIGETILVEDAYVHKFYAPTINRCTNCGKMDNNFIPCKNCNGVMYCSEKCSQNLFHEVECDMVFGAKDCVHGQSLSFILRSIVTGVNTFDSINEMMDFVNECLGSDPNEISTSVASCKAQYRTFFKLSSMIPQEKKQHFYKIGYILFKAIMGTKFGGKFETTATQRFLLHLIVHHAQILHINSFGGFSEPISEWNEFTNNDCSDKEQQDKLHLISSYFNHSCLPNIIKLEKDNLAVCKTLIPIKKGEQLFITYIEDEVFRTTNERRDYLNSRYGFDCKCKYCSSGLSMTPHLQDSNFRYVREKIEKGTFDMYTIAEIKKRCIAFLLQYHKMFDSMEVNFIVTNYGAMMQKELELI